MNNFIKKKETQQFSLSVEMPFDRFSDAIATALTKESVFSHLMTNTETLSAQIPLSQIQGTSEKLFSEAELRERAFALRDMNCEGETTFFNDVEELMFEISPEDYTCEVECMLDGDDCDHVLVVLRDDGHSVLMKVNSNGNLLQSDNHDYYKDRQSAQSAHQKNVIREDLQGISRCNSIVNDLTVHGTFSSRQHVEAAAERERLFDQVWRCYVELKGIKVHERTATLPRTVNNHIGGNYIENLNLTINN